MGIFRIPVPIGSEPRLASLIFPWYNRPRLTATTRRFFHNEKLVLITAKMRVSQAKTPQIIRVQKRGGPENQL